MILRIGDPSIQIRNLSSETLIKLINLDYLIKTNHSETQLCFQVYPPNDLIFSLNEFEKYIYSSEKKVVKKLSQLISQFLIKYLPPNEYLAYLKSIIANGIADSQPQASILASQLFVDSIKTDQGKKLIEG
ncbi:maestro heat-like repeat family member [Anaeramoeba flamelloides]|uniref:Maestro heat-like repeat family member n=1 Tax=Anaeramoeba flamelloides TaxID=1746091 RepID=A0AAV8A185_9EUKA|nr:maestro heat-like repeat family member [Anaeramoeba flamelloides]